MNNYNLVHLEQSASLQQLVSRQSQQKGNIDFRTILGGLFLKTRNILQDYADSEIKQMEIPGYAPFDKESPGATLMVSYAMTQTETQLSTLLSGLEFTLKTMPQKIDNLFS